MEFANRQWLYDFRELPKQFESAASAKAVASLQKRFANLVNAWNDDSNSEWLCRNYFAAKLIMAATLNINTMNYSESKNLRMVAPYLRYYALLSLLRSLVMTIPEQKWKDGELIKMTHNKTIKLATDYITRFSGIYAKKVNNLAKRLKSSRELISYHVPSSGDANILQADDFEEVCTVLCELAQLNSELIEQAIQKKRFNERFIFNLHDILPITSILLDENSFDDTEDSYRLGYLMRKYPFPANLRLMMTEGHVEDFFGAWYEKEEKEGNFNPDEGKDVIFDIP